MTRERISIVGAGLAGSLLAVYLARRGYRIELLEGRPDMRAHDISAGRSINLALADRGINALQAAGVFDHVKPLMIPMPGRMLHDVNGKLSFQAYGRGEEEVNYSVSRGELNKTLMTAAEQTGQVEIRFNSSCESYDLDSGRLTVRDENTGEHREIHSDIVLACDGAGSPVRQSLEKQAGLEVSEEILAHGYKELAIPPDAGGSWQIEKQALHIWPRGGYMLIALPNLDGSFTVTLFLPLKGEPSFASLATKAAVSDFFRRQFPDALQRIPNLAEDFFANPTGILGTIRCKQWQVGGRVALLGDAAHAVVPFHGQGMNCAFEDCFVLDQLMTEFDSDWSRVLPEFESARLENANAIADMALENYVEMRDAVRDPRFHLRKQLEFLLEEKFPEIFIPRYSMVMFHEEIPYAEAKKRGVVQETILRELTENVTELDDVDLERAEQLVTGKLKALSQSRTRS